VPSQPRRAGIQECSLHEKMKKLDLRKEDFGGLMAIRLDA
jgi:hypothetical protein